MKMEQTECSETSAYKIQTPGNYPEENIQHTEHGESLKSRIVYYSYFNLVVMNYGLPFWGNSAHSVQIFRMQNNMIRIMLGCKCRVSCRNLFMKLMSLLSASQYIFSVMHSLIKSKTSLQ